MIEVADTGLGIPADEQERLFERFFRTVQRHRAASPGRRPGTHVSKAIVDAHGGTVAVESAEGSGATFRVELPLARRITPRGAFGGNPQKGDRRPSA